MPENEVARTELELTLRRMCPEYVTFEMDDFQEGEYWESWRTRFSVGDHQFAELRIGWSSAVCGSFILDGDEHKTLTRSMLEYLIKKLLSNP